MPCRKQHSVWAKLLGCRQMLAPFGVIKTMTTFYNSLGKLAENNVDMPKFIWDEHNLYHILVEHKERDLSISEIESLFEDPNCIVQEAGNDKTGEKQFFCIGLGNKNIIRFVLYNVRNNKIRPFSVRTAKRNKERKLYYEQFR